MLRTLMHGLIFSAFSSSALMAQSLAEPQTEVLLTVSGSLAATNDANSAQLDLALLESIERRTIETSTIWTEGKQVFEGVSLSALVTALGLEGETLRATAINDYAVDIPMTDAVEGGAMVAYLLNGDKMSVRDKGPLWLVYPYDSDASFRSEVIYSRSIWQLNRIEAIE